MNDFTIFGDRERTGWATDSIAKAYISNFSQVVDNTFPSHLAAIDTPARVLDLCCGQGTLTSEIAKQGHSVTGLDFSKTMLNIARSKSPESDFIEGDAQALPFDDDTFDAVTCNFGIMHIPDQDRALSEIARVLKPKGTFSMTAWMGPDVSAAFRIVFSHARAALPEGATPPPAPDFFLYARQDDAAAKLKDAGLSLTSHSQLPLAWNIEEPEQLFFGFLHGTVAARMLLMTLDDETREKVGQLIALDVEEGFATGDTYTVPAPVAHILAKPIA